MLSPAWFGSYLRSPTITMTTWLNLQFCPVSSTINSWKCSLCRLAWTLLLLAPHACPSNTNSRLWKVVSQKCCRDRRELPASLAQAASLTATQKCRFFHLKRARDSICLVCRMGSPNDASFNWFREWTDLGVSHTWSCKFGEENSRTNSEPEAAQVLRWLIGSPWYRLPKDLAHLH